MTTPTGFDQYGLPANPVEVGLALGALPSTVAAKKAAAASRQPTPAADQPAPRVQTPDDPFAILGAKQTSPSLNPGSFGCDATQRAPAHVSPPAVADIAQPTVAFNPTGQQLQNAGVLHSQSGQWSGSNPAPATDGSGSALPSNTPNAIANVAAPPTPAPVPAPVAVDDSGVVQDSNGNKARWVNGQWIPVL